MTEGVSSSSDAAAQRASEQARLRKERREAKIKAGGSSRLDKITGIGGRVVGANVDIFPPDNEQAAPEGAPEATATTTAKAAAAGDPDEVDISEHFYSPGAERLMAQQRAAAAAAGAVPSPMAGGGGGGVGFPDMTEEQQAQLRQMMLGSGGGAPPPNAAEDPLAKMMAQMMGGAGGGAGAAAGLRLVDCGPAADAVAGLRGERDAVRANLHDGADGHSAVRVCAGRVRLVEGVAVKRAG
ncbi:hypothetical protein PWT90_07094 [Aphanocladium album]|nr:hypothetical protein PWT90_07094 [Aphanocladium album]